MEQEVAGERGLRRGVCGDGIDQLRREARAKRTSGRGPGPVSERGRGAGAGTPFAFLASAGAVRLSSSRIGRAGADVWDDDLDAAASDIDASRAMPLAFGIGAGYAGLAGAVYAGLVGSIEPHQFGSDLSLMVLAAGVIGSRW